MAKKLTLTELNKLDAQNNKKEKVSILDGKYEVTINKIFKDSDIEEVLLIYSTLLQNLNGASVVELKNTYSLLITLILRQFTDLPIPTSNDIDELVKVSKVLLDNNITAEVYSALPQDQLEHFHEKTTQVTGAIQKLFEQATEKDKVEDSVDGLN
ncbi:hypothetical protein D3C87_645720 [compost metagenome]